ncbi:MAG: PPC domain-containing protein [Planctomycetota bacterium]
MLKMLGRMSLASTLLLLGSGPVQAQGSLVLGMDDWTETGTLATTPGPWSGVTVNEAEPNDNHLNANAISVGDDYVGSIDSFGADFDTTAFTVAATDTMLAVTVPGAGTLTDTNLSLYDTDGTTLLAYNDDFNGLYSQISYTFSTAGTYYVAVGSYLATEGTYVMEMRTDGGNLRPAGGWAYIQHCLEAIAGGVTRPLHDGSVAVLGSADSSATSFDAGAAYHHCVPFAAANSSLSGMVNFYEGAAAINTFFADLGLGTVNPQIIVIAGSGAANDLDFLEGAALTANAAAISAYLNSGGGLISHGDGYYDTTTLGYAWLPLVFPGAGVVQEYNSPTLSNEGKFHLPGMDDADGYTSAEGYFTGLSLDTYFTAPGSPIPGPWSGVTVTEVEVNDDYTTANAMAIGDDAAGSIDLSGADYDWFSFTASAGTHVSLATVDVAGLTDTTLELYDTDGVTSLVYNDDGGPGFYSLIDYTFTAPGTYYIAVGSFGSNTGAYSLQARTATDNPGSPVIAGSLPSAWTWLGNDLGGINGKPLAIPTGTLLPASPWTLSLTNAAPSSTAFLVVGLATVYSNLKGGVLVPRNDVFVALPTNASGELSFGGTLGAPPSGASFYVQYWIRDLAGPYGYSASNGFAGTIP